MSPPFGRFLVRVYDATGEVEREITGCRSDPDIPFDSLSEASIYANGWNAQTVRAYPTGPDFSLAIAYDTEDRNCKPAGR